MPQIKEYLSRSNVQGPIASPGRKADPANASIASGLRAFGEGVQDLGEGLQKRQEQKETLQVATDLADMNARLSNDWRERLRTADPNDDQLSSKFMEDFDDQMSKVGENLTTRAAKDYYEKNLANIRAGFLESTVHGQAELASVQAKTNYRTVVNSYSSSVRDNPDQFQTAMSAHSDAVETLIKQGLPVEAAMQLKQQGNEAIARSAIQGWIEVDPDGTKKRLEKGEWDAFVSGETKDALYGEIDRQKRAMELQQKKYEEDQKKAKVEAQKATQDKFLDLMQQGKLTPRDIMDSDLEPTGAGSKEHYLDRLEKEMTAPIKTNAAVRNTLLSRINLPDGDKNKITDESQLNPYFSNLSNSDIKFLRSEIRKTGTEEGKQESALKAQVMKVATDRLTKGSGMKDPRGQEQLLMFQQAYFEAFDKGRKEGKSVLEMTKPDFINPIIQQFERSPQEKIQDRINAFKSVSDDKKRKPGESQADYLKRMGH